MTKQTPRMVSKTSPEIVDAATWADSDIEEEQGKTKASPMSPRVALLRTFPRQVLGCLPLDSYLAICYSLTLLTVLSLVIMGKYSVVGE